MAGVGDRLHGWQERVRAARGMRRLGLALAAGILSNLAMAPFFFAPILFVTLPVLIWLIDGAVLADGSLRTRALSAALAGWAFGFGYFFFGLFWIGEAFLVESRHLWMLPIAVTVMPAGLALFWAGATAAATLLWRLDGGRIMVLAITLSVAEWLRGHVLTGFPWNVIGYALTWPVVLMQSAGLVGIYGLTLIAVPVFAAPLVLGAAAPGDGRRWAGLRALAVTGVPLVVLAGYGWVRLATAPEGAAEGVRLRIVQPSVPQREKWMAEKQASIFQEHLDLSRTNPAGVRDDMAGITLLVWPEAAMPFLPLQHPEALAAIGALLPDQAFLVTGALRGEGEGVTPGSHEPFRAYNSLMTFDGAGALAGIYDKTHLVPFGEYLPWRSTLEALGIEQLTQRGSFMPGITPRPTLSIPGLPPIGGLICYEAIFPGVGAAAAEKPGVLVNVSNDGWFGNTTGPRQHFHQARVRAVEEGLPLIRAANNGISAVIDSSGRVTGMLEMNVKGTLDSELPLARPAPLYSILGDAIFLIGLVLAAITYFFLRKDNQSGA